MIGFAFAMVASVMATTQDPAPPAQAPLPRPAPAAASSSVRSITTQSAPRAGTPTRTSCGWQAETGSTLRRRVCREVPINGALGDPEAQALLRQLQGIRHDPQTRPGGG